MKMSLLSLIALLLAQSALAATPSFNFIELGLSSRNINGSSLNGITAKLSGQFNENFFLRGEVTAETDDYVDSWGDEIKDTLLYRQIGIGFAIKNEHSATYFALDLGDYNIDHQDSCCGGYYDEEYSLTDSIKVVSAGHRQKIGERFELNLELSNLDWKWKFGEKSTYTRGVASVFYDFKNSRFPIQIGITYSRIDAIWGEQFQVGARYNF